MLTLYDETDKNKYDKYTINLGGDFSKRREQKC
jgi:hypothetical protein